VTVTGRMSVGCWWRAGLRNFDHQAKRNHGRASATRVEASVGDMGRKSPGGRRDGTMQVPNGILQSAQFWPIRTEHKC